MDTLLELAASAIVTGNQFTIFEISGLLGVALYVGNYGTLQLGLMDGNSMRYTIQSGSAASLVLISLLQDWNMASALIQIMWIGISIVGICRALIKRRQRAERSATSVDAFSEYQQYPRRPQWPQV
jgi:hypothetical protein